MVAPVNSSLKRGFRVIPKKALSAELRVLRTEFDSEPTISPCQTLPPDFVTRFTTEPELRPYSGPKLFVVIWYSFTKRGLLKNKPGPATELSLLFCPSICWSLLRLRMPLTE